MLLGYSLTYRPYIGLIYGRYLQWIKMDQHGNFWVYSIPGQSQRSSSAPHPLSDPWRCHLIPRWGSHLLKDGWQRAIDWALPCDTEPDWMLHVLYKHAWRILQMQKTWAETTCKNNLFDLNVQIKDGAWLFLLSSLPLMPPSQVNTQFYVNTKSLKTLHHTDSSTRTWFTNTATMICWGCGCGLDLESAWRILVTCATCRFLNTFEVRVTHSTNSGYPSTSAYGLELPCQYLSGRWLQRWPGHRAWCDRKGAPTVSSPTGARNFYRVSGWTWFNWFCTKHRSIVHNTQHGFQHKRLQHVECPQKSNWQWQQWQHIWQQYAKSW